MWVIWMMGCVKTPVNRVTPEPTVEVEQEPVQEIEAVPTLVAANGQYDTIPLEKELVRLAVVQSDATSIKEGDVPHEEEGLTAINKKYGLYTEIVNENMPINSRS